MKLSMEKFFVFDVESIGLHGEGFAVGYVVIDRDGVRLEEGVMACDPRACAGSAEGHLWVAANVPKMEYAYASPRDVRSAFWATWRRWADQGATAAADCPWPVEARFLAKAVDDDPSRKAQGPYPLLDLTSVFSVLGMWQAAYAVRLLDELPVHHPLSDARLSSRFFAEALGKQEGVTS